MSCFGNNQVFTYAVFERDELGSWFRTNKLFVLDFPKLQKSYAGVTTTIITSTFLKQVFEMTNISGFGAALHGRTNIYDEIIIQWRTPHWKLVRIK